MQKGDSSTQELKPEEQKSVAKKTNFEAKKKISNPRLRTEKENLIAGPLDYFLLIYSLASFQEDLFFF